jgi:diguanylate cyclase (GGDEF)-like protein
LAVPLAIRNKTLGVIALADATNKQNFNQSDLHILTLFAQQAAIAIDNAQLLEQITSSLINTETLYQTARALIITENLNDLLQNLVDRLAVTLPADRVILITLKTETQTIINYVIGGNRSYLADRVSYQQLMDGLTGWVMREGKTAISHFKNPDTREKSYVQKTREAYQAGTIIVVPLRYRQEILGTLTAIHFAENDYPQTKVELLETIASHAAIAITNAQLFEEIQQLAETDELTKINNRRQLFKLGEQAFNHAIRYNESLSVIMLDIDHFKLINDTYGHATGDMVLRELAQFALDNIRAVDILGRYGGEEFVIILPKASLTQGIEIAERLRYQVESKSIVTSVGTLKTTISLGVADLSTPVPNLATLIDRADTALYQAKRAGRNQVTSLKVDGMLSNRPLSSRSQDNNTG